MYVHGYEPRERDRLYDQAGILLDLLQSDTSYPDGSSVLEVGCGVGAQTIPLARRSPAAHFTSIDLSADSISLARRRVEQEGLTNVDLLRANILDPPFGPDSFDHVFICFVLEHLAAPGKALSLLNRTLRPGGTITVVEGDHGSTYFYPDSARAHAAIQALIELQHRSGGNGLIGRQLYPLLVQAGFESVRVSPRMVYVDSSHPDRVEGFTKKTFTAMIEGVREPAIAARLIDPKEFDEGVQDLYRTMQEDGVFCYTFFKALGKKATTRPA